MSATYFYTFTRDDGSEVTIEYSARGGEPASYDDPGCGPEIEIESVWTEPDGAKVKLSDADADRAMDQIAEHHEPDTGPDPDDERDRRVDDELTGHGR